MHKSLWLLLVFAIFVSCRKQRDIPAPPDAVLLKDIVVNSLPAPYYHFEYDSSDKVSFVSFASDFTRYDVLYVGGRISEMRNNIIVNKDRLQYTYNSAGKVEFIKYADSTGFVYKTLDLFYDGSKLIKVNRARRVSAGFVLEKTLTMSYYPDGNLMDITYHFWPFEAQTEAAYTSHFERYDNNINVDDFSLLHDEFFDHLFLLPGVRLQLSNPAKEIRTGDGVNYSAEYTYTYNGKNEPLSRTGNVVILNGTQAGQQFQTNTSFSYYQ